jgi:hypothetical protein
MTWWALRTPPPERDESGRLTPEVLTAARVRVRRALLVLILVSIAAGLLAYACSRTSSRACCDPAAAGTQCRTCSSPPPAMRR